MGSASRVLLAYFFAGAATASTFGVYVLRADYKMAQVKGLCESLDEHISALENLKEAEPSARLDARVDNEMSPHKFSSTTTFSTMIISTATTTFSTTTTSSSTTMTTTTTTTTLPTTTTTTTRTITTFPTTTTITFSIDFSHFFPTGFSPFFSSKK